MRILGSIFGALMVLAGAVWFLQGINLLPGSFMTGQTRWAVYGALMILVGVILIVRVNRRPIDTAGRRR